MLRNLSNPQTDLTKATHVYAMYSWLSKYTGEPCHELVKIVPTKGESVSELIKSVEEKPLVELRGTKAKLYQIYVEQPDETEVRP